MSRVLHSALKGGDEQEQRGLETLTLGEGRSMAWDDEWDKVKKGAGSLWSGLSRARSEDHWFHERVLHQWMRCWKSIRASGSGVWGEIKKEEGGAWEWK